MAGKVKWEYFGRGLSAEKAAADRDQGLREQGVIPKYTQRQSDNIEAPTFIELAIEYIKVKAAGELTPSSRQALVYSLEGCILPELGDIEATRLTQARLDQYVEKRLKTPIKVWTGKKDHQKQKTVTRPDGSPKLVSRSSVCRELDNIQAILNWSATKKYILNNPVRGHNKPKKDNAIIRPPSLAETKKSSPGAAFNIGFVW